MYWLQALGQEAVLSAAESAPDLAALELPQHGTPDNKLLSRLATFPQQSWTPVTQSSRHAAQPTAAAARQAGVGTMMPEGVTDSRHVSQQAAAHSAPHHGFLFSVSVGSCPSLYWLGQYKDGRFDIQHALGPFPLDMGDIAYAPNVMHDAYVSTTRGLQMSNTASSSNRFYTCMCLLCILWLPN